MSETFKTPKPGIYTPDMNLPISTLTNNVRDALVKARGQIHDIVHSKKACADYVEDLDGLLTCGIVSLHHALEKMKKYEIEREDNLRGQSYAFNVRGIGSDTCPCCYVCFGHNDQLMSNIAAFVKSKEEGEKITGLFTSICVPTARLDFRPSEPNWIQVKVGACEKHRHCLEDLARRTYENHGRIRAYDIIESRKVEDQTEPKYK